MGIWGGEANQTCRVLKSQNQRMVWEERREKAFWWRCLHFLVFPVEGHIFIWQNCGKSGLKYQYILETYSPKRSDLGKRDRHARSCWWVCDVVDGMWLIGADGTRDASSMDYLLKDGHNFLMITFDIDTSKRPLWTNAGTASILWFAHPTTGAQPQDLPSKNLNFGGSLFKNKIQSSLVRLVWCVTLPWNSMHCAELDLPWRNILMPRQLRQCAAVGCGWLQLRFFSEMGKILTHDIKQTTSM